MYDMNFKMNQKIKNNDKIKQTKYSRKNCPYNNHKTNLLLFYSLYDKM